MDVDHEDLAEEVRKEEGHKVCDEQCQHHVGDTFATSHYSNAPEGEGRVIHELVSNVIPSVAMVTHTMPLHDTAITSRMKRI